ncbi:MAG: glycosyltransferase family 4 protein [Draconibacterium sp.]
MKILLANKFFHLNGGSETVFFQEREFLNRKGYRIIDFSMLDDRNLPSHYSHFFINKIDYQQNLSLKDKIHQAVSFIHSDEAVRKLEQLIALEKPDIAHLHNIYHQLTPSIIPVLKKHGVKIVTTLHDYKLICPSYIALKNNNICEACQGRFFWKPFTSNCQNSYLQGLLLSLEAYWHKWTGSYNGVDLFLAPSKFLASLISKRISPDKIQVLHNGIDADKYQATFSDHGYALYFGRISKEKGIATLLQAHQQLSEKFPLKVVGTGPLEQELKKSYPFAEYLGYQSGEALHTTIQNASFVVVPSEWYENCSMFVLESMAYGKPVIGSRIGGIPEQVEDGKTGLLFEMGSIQNLKNKMATLIENRALRLTMGKAAQNKLQNEYSNAQHNKKLLKLYSTVLSSVQ